MASSAHACLARWLALACLLGARAAWAGEPVPEYDLKAAFVFNFAVFTEWPQEALAASAPVVVCAGHASAMLPALGQLGEKLINGHRVSVRAAQAAPLRSCHVLVLGSGDRERWPQIKRELAGATVLTISDDPAISSSGGAVIALSMEQRRIGFDVDLGAARSAHLNLSSKLLRLARSVQ